MVLILYQDASEIIMIVKNERVIKTLNWLNTAGSWITIQLCLIAAMLSITAAVCAVALRLVPSIWDWGVAVTQIITFMVSAMFVGDHLNRHTGWNSSNSITRVWFNRDSTKQWFLNRESHISTFTIKTIDLLEALGICLKYNAIAIAVVGVLYGVVEVVKSIKWDIGMLYILVGMIGTVLAVYLISIVSSKAKTFYTFCKEMMAINRMINVSGAGEPWDTRVSIVKEWMSCTARLKRMERQCSPADQRMHLENRINLIGKSLLTASFQVKPAGEYASRATLSQVSKELNQLGRDLLNDKQVADAHLFQVREKHEESKKKPADTAA